MKVTPADIDTLARTIYGEARGEPFKGMVGVAWVVRNRVEADLHRDGKPDWWGETVTEVCRKKWQFTCWIDQYKKIAEVPETDPIFMRCKAAALLVLSGSLNDPTGGSTHYYASYIQAPKWAQGKEPTAVIGRHRFYAGVEV